MTQREMQMLNMVSLPTPSLKNSLILLWMVFLAPILWGCAPASAPDEAGNIVADQYFPPDTPIPVVADNTTDSVKPSARATDEGIAPTTPKPAKSKGDVVIGMLVPLTGNQAEMGKQLRDAALLGLYDKQQSLAKAQKTYTPQLLIRDSGDSPQKLEAALQELIEAGATVILGPLMAADVKLASKTALKAGIPLISFSNSVDVAKEGVYVFGFDPAEQIERVITFALQSQIPHYAAIAPQNDYGRRVVQHVSAQLEAKKLVLKPVEFINEGQLPPPLSVNRITETMVEWGETRKALFLPLTGKPLEAAAMAVLTHKKTNAPFIKLLGTGLWDDPEVTAIPALQGAWFATSDPEITANFAKKFYKSYHYVPLRLASLGYDAVSFVTSLALEKGKTAFKRENLTASEGFVGAANGLFRLKRNGTVQRSLAVVEIGKGSFYVIDAAPTGF
jgi:ABC-type branched-subunit amino acid transport system substrate-binding protein